jgi:DNA-binding transcriptional regulator YiaG
MPNILSYLNVHIRKLARREVKGLIADAKKRGTEHRRSIATLKREIAILKREVGGLKKNGYKTPKAPMPVPEKARLRIDGLKTHRAKLGFSAKDYGKLLGVSALTVYNWEAKKSKPRRSQLPAIISVRGLGKRDALLKLSE